MKTEDEKIDTKKFKGTLFFESEDKIKAQQQKLDTLTIEQLGHFEYELPGLDVGQRWEDALRSTMRTYDAAEMEIGRHYQLIEYTRTKSQWSWDKLDVFGAKETHSDTIESGTFA